MTQADIHILMAALKERARNGRLAGIEIEYWVGGGQPPPYYRSDQFRLLAIAGRDMLEFATLRFDNRYEPPNIIEKWQLPAQPADVSDLLELLAAIPAFTARYPEEDNPGIADVLSTEIIATLGPVEHKRRYYRRIPSAIEPLRAAIDRLVGRVKREGERGLFHQGRRIPSDTDKGK